MKKVLTSMLSLTLLCGCSLGTTVLTPDYSSGRHKFENIDVKNTTKKGQSCEVVIPIMLLTGPLGKTDASVMQIAQSKNMSKITYVEKHYEGVLPFFYQKCYTVYGY